MPEKYQIVYRDQPEWDIIGGGIQEYNAQKAGDDHGKNLHGDVIKKGVVMLLRHDERGAGGPGLPRPARGSGRMILSRLRLWRW